MKPSNDLLSSPKQRLNLKALLPTAHWLHRELALGLHDVFGRERHLFSISHSSPERVGNFLTDQNIDGGIFYFNQLSEQRLAVASGIPIINISGKQARNQVPTIHFDDKAVGRMAGDYLRTFAAREFAWVGVGAHAFSCERISGFLETFPDAGDVAGLFLDRDPGCDPEWDGKWVSESGRINWLQARKKPLALYLSDTAEGWLELIEQAGLRNPEDVYLLQSGGPATPEPWETHPVSTVDLNARELGRKAAQTLLQRMQGEDVPEVQLISPKGILERMSTAHLPSDDELVAEMVRYIREHIREVTTVKELAEQAPVCRSLLERRFQKSLNMGVAGVMRQERLQKAQRLLLETDWTVEDIAEQVGYRQVNRLYEALRKETGLTPRQFRAGD